MSRSLPRRQMAPASTNQRRARSVDCSVSPACWRGIDNEGYEDDRGSLRHTAEQHRENRLSSLAVDCCGVVGGVDEDRRSPGAAEEDSKKRRSSIRPSFSRWKAVRRKNNSRTPWWCRSPKPIGKRRRRRDGRQLDLNLIHLSAGGSQLGQTRPSDGLRSQVMTRSTDVPPAERRTSGRGTRRHHNTPMTTTTTEGLTHLDSPQQQHRTDMLPDILNSHLPPPYSTLPQTTERGGGRRLPPPSHPPPPPPPHIVPSLCNPITPCPASPTPRRCHPFQPRGRLRASGRMVVGSGHGSMEADEPKHCCGVIVTQTVSIRWFILMIAFVGLCCAIVGTVLGALKATGREHLTVSLLMIGVGIVLITVSGIAWRLTSHDAPSCRAMLGLQPTNQEPNRRFLPRVPPYGRPPHPYAAMLYPEFQYRPPPPSYQASMQEYRLRLLLLDRQHGAPSTSLSPVSPPPTYRSHASSTLHSNRPPLNFVERDYSRPPSYRSRASSVAVLRPNNTDTMDSRQTVESRNNTTDSRHHRQQTEGGTRSGTPSHSRNPSLTLSFLSHESLFNGSGHSRPVDGVPVATTGEHINPSLFTSPSAESRTSVVAGLSDDSPIANHHPPTEPPKWTTKAEDPSMVTLRKNPDINTVTIVQTTDSSQVVNRDTVIVSITGQHRLVPGGENHEVQVLAQV